VGRAAAPDELLRDLAPRVLAVLLRRYGQFDECEDAVQEALLAAAMQWPVEGGAAESGRLAGDRGRAPVDRAVAP